MQAVILVVTIASWEGGITQARWMFPKIGVPQNGLVYFMENPIKIGMIWGYHYFWKHPYSNNQRMASLLGFRSGWASWVDNIDGLVDGPLATRTFRCFFFTNNPTVDG